MAQLFGVSGWERSFRRSTLTGDAHERREYIEKGTNLAERIACAKVALASRLAVADVFWPSGQTKVKGLSIREEAKVAAYLSTVAEGVFPVLLFFYSSARRPDFPLGLFGMMMVI